MGAYKTYMRGPRNMTVEESFALGMRFTDTPQAEGYCKSLINFDFKDMGQILVPRNGYQQLHIEAMGSDARSYAVHHTAQGTLRNTLTGEDQSRRYILFAYQEGEYGWFDFANAKILMEQELSTDYSDTQHKRFVNLLPFLRSGIVGEGEEAAEVFDRYRIKRTPRIRTQLLHNISLTDNTIFNGTPYMPVYTMLNNTAILPVEYTPYETGIPVDGFAKLIFTTTDNATYYAELQYIEPYAASPTEAINYGYNMLKANPYSFSDSLSAAVPANYIIMEGLLPYADEACTTVKFNAKVGEPVTFKLFAQYPDETSQYKFRWEVRELGAENVSIYEDQTTTSRVFTYDDDLQDAGVFLTIRPPYKQCSITVTAYSTTDLTEPLQVLTLGSYSLTADTPGTTNNIEVKTYPVHTATDLCTWRQHIVYWGVRGAANMIFVSDTNRPGYVPYPNNSHIFEEQVVACVPYLGELLVFTENKLYRLKWSADGLTYTADMIQDKLYMSPFDKETITVVQNMVFFKNGNYFYMVVPKTSSIQPGALQLAPISTPITNLLDNFQQEVGRMADELYNFSNGDIFPPLQSTTFRGLEIHDYHNYLDTAAVRNVYKFRLVDYSRETGAVVRVLCYVDYILNYDTLSRAWTSYLMQSNETRLWPYRQNVTDTTVFIQAVNKPTVVMELDEFGEPTVPVEGFMVRCSFVKPNVLDPRDNFLLAEDTTILSRVLRNHQVMDTGYREHSTQYKKRYREIQFKINNRGQESLQFGTEFMIDDMLRKPLYAFATRHITDPEASDFGYIYVERIPNEVETLGGAAILTPDDESDAPYVQAEVTVPDRDVVLNSTGWVLDVSQLSQVATAKVRFRVSGKGHSPRLLLISYNDTLYELMNHNWVYRTMNAR